MGQYKKSNQKEKTLFTFFNVLSINKGDRMSYWVGHSRLKELYVNSLFERKNMIEDMESELTEALKKVQIMTIWRWLKRKMLMKPSLQKPRLATIWKLILKKNERHKHINRQ